MTLFLYLTANVKFVRIKVRRIYESFACSLEKEKDSSQPVLVFSDDREIYGGDGSLVLTPCSGPIGNPLTN